jgi:phenylalanyl-tRNA synthetase beta chain
MTISYHWLSDYVPVIIDPERLSKILTSIGLEVESFSKYEEIKGGLQGLVIGEVLSVEKHPNADKLTITKVAVGNGAPLQIVCGAPNVAAGQKVVVAPAGSTIHPVNGEPLTMKVAKIRNVESHGMICAEDEIGLGTSHEGILVLSPEAKPGMPASDYFQVYTDWVYEIGLTPNRMDAMSHWGVARDVCAWLSQHEKKTLAAGVTEFRPKLPLPNGFKADDASLTIEVQVNNTRACPRYSGLSISGITIAPSPKWLQQKLKAVGLRPINNIVDITNFIQHETGQPLHAFDADKLNGSKIIVKNLPEGTPFITLDEKERKLSAEDLMICDANGGICIAGVFGGLHSGVTENTKNIFLESACFDPVSIRKTSFRHGLRTDAAARFEKGTDISATVTVLKRAAQLIKEICGGKISSDIVDIYPVPREKKQVSLKYHFLKKLSGHNYHPDAVKNILTNLGFEIIKDSIDEIRVAVPHSKPDISLPADIVEEILRIDGLDNVKIPEAILLSPAMEESEAAEIYREKLSGYLVGLGFHEIMTNSITNEAYFSGEEKKSVVKLLNNLSAELNSLRPAMLETGLEAVAYNLNRKNHNLKLFEFGKIYRLAEKKYEEQEQLCLLVTGEKQEPSWNNRPGPADLYYLKGVAAAVLKLLGMDTYGLSPLQNEQFETGLKISVQGKDVAFLGIAAKPVVRRFDIKQPVLYAVFQWDTLMEMTETARLKFQPVPKFPSVQRDLAIVVDSRLPYAEVEKTVQKNKPPALQDLKLFDIFESEKIGTGKKSIAISLTFIDEEKTLTDPEIEQWMSRIITALEKDLGAQIRK